VKRLAALVFVVSSIAANVSVSAQGQCGAKNRVALAGTMDTPWDLHIQFNPEIAPLNVPFDTIVTICSQQKLSPTRVTVDATMPAHKHGMNYEPKTKRIGDNRYEVKNLLFHMPGVWRLEITAYEGKKPHRFTHDVTVK